MLKDSPKKQQVLLRIIGEEWPFWDSVDVFFSFFLFRFCLFCWVFFRFHTCLQKEAHREKQGAFVEKNILEMMWNLRLQLEDGTLMENLL